MYLCSLLIPLLPSRLSPPPPLPTPPFSFFLLLLLSLLLPSPSSFPSSPYSSLLLLPPPPPPLSFQFDSFSFTFSPPSPSPPPLPSLSLSKYFVRKQTSKILTRWIISIWNVLLNWATVILAAVHSACMFQTHFRAFSSQYNPYMKEVNMSEYW